MHQLLVMVVSNDDSPPLESLVVTFHHRLETGTDCCHDPRHVDRAHVFPVLICGFFDGRASHTVGDNFPSYYP